MHKLINFIKSDTRKILSTNVTLPKIQKIYFYSLIIEMINKKIFRNKREIYYLAVPLFKNQSTVDRLVNNLSKDFPLINNFVKASFKGLFYGKIEYLLNDKIIKSFNKIELIPDFSLIKEIKFYDKFCLVIEKESLFDFICNFNKIKDCLLVTGKGYPCKNTIKFLEKVTIPIYGLFDFDPFGFNIFLNYSKYIKINRLGLVLEDILVKKNIKINQINNELNILKEKSNELIPLNKYDYRMIKSLEEKAPELKNDLLFLKGLGMKIELEAFVKKDSFFYENYVKEKLKRYY